MKFKALYLYNSLYIMVEQNPVIPNINIGAMILYTISFKLTIVFILDL